MPSKTQPPASVWENRDIKPPASRPKPKPRAKKAPFLLSPAGKILLVALVLGVTLGTVTFTYYYVKYSRLIDQKLHAGPFAETSKIYAASKVIIVGDKMSPAE